MVSVGMVKLVASPSELGLPLELGLNPGHSLDLPNVCSLDPIV